VIYGDVVITGPPQYGEATEVNTAMVDYRNGGLLLVT
jgi:hypothetical protein